MGTVVSANTACRFNWRETVDKNFFGGNFPWDSDEIPDWLSYEPEEVREFYGHPERAPRWFDFEL